MYNPTNLIHIYVYLVSCVVYVMALMPGDEEEISKGPLPPYRVYSYDVHAYCTSMVHAQNERLMFCLCNTKCFCRVSSQQKGQQYCNKNI